MTTTMAPLRCIGLRQVVLSEDGNAVLLELAMANGKTFPLELEPHGVELLMRALVASAQALGGASAASPRPALSDAQAQAQAVVVTADAIDVRHADDGPPCLLLRVGCVDLSVPLPGSPGSPDAAALAQALRAG